MVSANGLHAARARGRNTGRLVHEFLRARIAGLELRLGAALSENDLAAELGVSRTPVRESLVLLGEEGLVDVYPQLGTFVSWIRPQAVASARFVREALEPAALRDGVPQATERDVLEPRALLAGQAEAGRRGDPETFLRLDEEFHARLMAVGGHGDVWPVAGRAKTHLDRARRLSLPPEDRITLLVQQHTDVVDALERGDAGGAGTALRGHLRQVFADVGAIRDRHPELSGGDDSAPPRRQPRAKEQHR
ncbi:GntR family transcriptional regulator [Streptomyces sp. MJP52]|uniref:GntR family transcriptional regulator n=1 Tax=Streptomyces sp. MJP52 TaxID=2940555 RepID=UPI002474D3CB|nr:GntR family transcriptional regulator [Streptomyces sp. MJP52]MDH6228408.1 DNA-binding GntR family transcriptional regulator [Streptomyces sp. MJP52]